MNRGKKKVRSGSISGEKGYGLHGGLGRRTVLDGETEPEKDLLNIYE